jgi:predicted nucleotidyltransferase
MRKAAEAAQYVGQTDPVCAAYLFGSHVEGTPDQWSDIDVALFLEGAENWDMQQKAELMGLVQANVSPELEVHLFSAKAYHKPDRGSFVQYILKHGIPLNVENQGE